MKVKVTREVINGEYLTLLDGEVEGHPYRALVKAGKNVFSDAGVCWCMLLARKDKDADAENILSDFEVVMPDGRRLSNVTTDPRMVALARRATSGGGETDSFPEWDEALAELHSGRDAVGGRWGKPTLTPVIWDIEAVVRAHYL